MKISLSLLCVFIIFKAQSQSIISGFVKDFSTNREIEGVHVSLKDRLAGTVTNADGYFSLNVQNIGDQDSIFFSAISYEKKGLKLKPILYSDNINVELTKSAIVLQEIIIRPDKIDAKQIIKFVRKNFEKNYHLQLKDLEGFYREVVKFDGRYGGFTESLINIKDIDQLLNGKDNSVKNHFIVKNQFEMLAARRSDYKKELCLSGPFMGVRIIMLMELFYYWRRTYDDLFRGKNFLKGNNFSFLHMDTYEGKEVYVVEYKSNKTNYIRILGRSQITLKIFVEKESYGVLRIETEVRKHNDPEFQFQGVMDYIKFNDKWYPKYIAYSHTYQAVPYMIKDHIPNIEEFVEIYLSKGDGRFKNHSLGVLSEKQNRKKEPLHPGGEFMNLPKYDASFWKDQAYQATKDFDLVQKELGKHTSLEDQFSKNSGKWIINEEYCVEEINKIKNN